MEQPLVSLMMICYNNVAYIKAAIDSVKAQTYTNWELIINDDCSTDGSWELAQALAQGDSRIKVYRNEQNLKTPGNRAAAAKHLTGDLVGHVDADDLLYPYSVEHMVRVFVKNPEVAFAYSDMADIDAKGKVVGYRAAPDACGNLSLHGWRHFGVFRMSAYKAVAGYNAALTRGCEDGDLFMQLVEHSKFVRLPEVLYAYRNHGENNSMKNHKCDSCPDRPTCNYIRVWSKHAGYDPITFTPLKIEALEEKK